MVAGAVFAGSFASVFGAEPVFYSTFAESEIRIARPQKTAAPVLSETSAKDDTTTPGGISGLLVGKPLYRSDLRFADIALEPIFGKVNGAQVSVTW